MDTINNLISGNFKYLLLGAIPWILGSVTYYLMPFITLLINNFLHVFEMSDRNDYDNSKKMIKYIYDNSQLVESYMFMNGKKYPNGLCISFSKLFVGKININNVGIHGSIERSIWYMGIKPMVELNSKPITDPEIKKLTSSELKRYNLETPREIKIMEQNGQENILNLYYRPTAKQQVVIQNIIKTYESIRCRINNSTATILISGQSGSGKSTISKLIASHFGSTLTYDFDIKRNNINFLYVNPTESSPLICQVDEFDVYIKWMHENTINGKIKVSKGDEAMGMSSDDIIGNKQKYNMLMSDIIRLKRNVIYIFTTNKPLEWFDELDPSYIAQSRIDYKCIMDGDARLEADVRLD